MTGASLQDRFEQAFGSPPDAIVRSPGRVNMIGEHTDYNDGWALPAALDLGTDVAVRRRVSGSRPSSSTPATPSSPAS